MKVSASVKPRCDNCRIAIEPMLNIGDWHTRILDDQWTVETEDGSLSAHFEHTIAITEDGPKILTVHT